MNFTDKHYIIGIDLGTTNSAVSYVDLDAGSPSARRIKLFKISQLTGYGEVTPLPTLPSFLYIPGEYDITPEAIELPWEREVRHRSDENFVGAFARDHGSKIPSRLVSSAKSWLCHSNADRHGPILPYGVQTDGKQHELYKISPVQATAAYLKHIRQAWNYSKGANEELYLENQLVNITVPASFDEVARDLTLESAALAGLNDVTLLEEPLAAFYAWLIRHESDWSEHVEPNELILVCDVGGGTTDFTLITLREVDGSPRFERIAVGDHLILGGDNIDLALASRLEKRFGKQNVSLTGDRWKTLCHQCRQAKEDLLDGRANSSTITVIGEGGQLIANTVTAALSREDVEETVVDGFFPLVERQGSRASAKRTGITEFGLPYEQEPAITRHLGDFLERHRADVARVLKTDNYAPDLILFNGGSLKAELIQTRIRSALRQWFGKNDDNWPRVLQNPNLDLAVAMGAAYYGLVKIGQGVRVGSGSARAFYLGVAASDDRAEASPKASAFKTEPGGVEHPSDQTEKLAVCLVERGLEEGSEIRLQDKAIEVLTNQPVSFDLYSSSFRSGERCGELVTVDDSLTPLPPLQTVIQFGKKGGKTRIPVQIEASYTEIGTLAVWCRSKVSNHRWQLRFKLRDQNTVAEVEEREVFDEALVQKAQAEVRALFTPDQHQTPQEQIEAFNQIVKKISRIVERSKSAWPLGLLRALGDQLLERVEARAYTPLYEHKWLNLTGFCLRPGFGESLDPHRVKAAWKIYAKGPLHIKNPQVRIEWQIFWRRLAGGLSAGHQRQFIQSLTPLMASKKGAKTRIPPQERIEMWMALANMERLMVKDKVKWGRLLLNEMTPKKSKPQHFWALSRLGARELLYGPVDRVVPIDEVSAWIETLLSQDWRNPKPVGRALIQLARKTGDRMRDIEPALIERIIGKLASYDNQDFEIKPLQDVVPLAQSEESAIFGESLPTGLVLKL